MTHPIARSTHALPQTQNTAPVYEFRALYTHDLRRKQKRWQDGTLKYHTFNKRIMVYDTLKNFIGDSHWKESDGLQDGDEVELEAGVLVQVGECVASQETDLRGLLERPKKDQGEGEKRGANVDGSARELSRTARMTPGGNTAPQGREYLRHKSLNALLGTPRGALGKAALPTKSPFEVRHGVGGENERAAKRLRVEGEQGWNVTRMTTSIKGSKSKETPLWTADARNKTAAKPSAKKSNPLPAGQRRLDMREVIDITSDKDESLRSDITLPDTLPILHGATPTLKPRRTPAVPRSWRKVTPPAVHMVEPKSPSVSTTNKVSDVEASIAPIGLRDEEFEDIENILLPDETPVKEPKNTRLKPLKLVKQRPRNKLLCAKDPPRTKPSQQVNTANRDVMEIECPVPMVVDKQKSKTTGDSTNKTSVKSKSKRESKRALAERERLRSSSPAFSTMRKGETSQKVDGALNKGGVHEMTMAHGIMDQRILAVRQSPVKNSDPRAFRRVQSENDANVPFPLEDRSSIPQLDDERIQPAAADTSPAKRKQSNGAKKAMQRSLSENEGAKKYQRARNEQEKGPWTIEALDLFDWRPPDWEERQKRVELSSFIDVEVAG